MKILKTAELEMKAIFVGSKLATTTFLSFDIRTTVGPLKVYLQNLKSLRSLRSLPVFEASAYQFLRFWSLRNLPFSREIPKRIRFRCVRSLRKPEEAEKCTKRIHPSLSYRCFGSCPVGLSRILCLGPGP